MNRNKQVYRCPGNRQSGLVRGDWNDTWSGLPDQPKADNLPACYRLNISNQWHPDPGQRPFYATKLARLRSTSQAIVLFDGSENAALWHHAAWWEVNQPNGGVRKNFKVNVAFDRHFKRGNYTFADGHAESLAWDDTWRPVVPNDSKTDPRGMWWVTAD